MVLAVAGAEAEGAVGVKVARGGTASTALAIALPGTFPRQVAVVPPQVRHVGGGNAGEGMVLERRPSSSVRAEVEGRVVQPAGFRDASADVVDVRMAEPPGQSPPVSAPSVGPTARDTKAGVRPVRRVDAEIPLFASPSGTPVGRTTACEGVGSTLTGLAPAQIRNARPDLRMGPESLPAAVPALGKPLITAMGPERPFGRAAATVVAMEVAQTRVVVKGTEGRANAAQAAASSKATARLCRRSQQLPCPRSGCAPLAIPRAVGGRPGDVARVGPPFRAP